mgnify:CR=1 FL=1
MKKILVIGITVALGVILTSATLLWRVAMRPNVSGNGPYKIFIQERSTMKELLQTLDSSGALKDESSFIITSRLKGFDRSIKPGFYILESGMNNNHIVNMLRAGRQTPVNVTFNNLRTLNDLAGHIGGQIEADSSSIIAFLSNQSNYSDDGFKPETVISVFIPDTYQLYWTTDAEGLYKRMLREYKGFWNKDRIAAASALGLTPVDVSILASIIDDEVAKDDEKPRIAGVYLNRLRLGIPLQACPTIKFALNDFTIRRVLYQHLKVESPYNTYKYRGLPPGPVRCPTKAGIEAVLNAEKHDYLYFAAKADFSGYHHFSRTLAEHNKYAYAYQRELNKRKIYE